MSELTQYEKQAHDLLFTESEPRFSSDYQKWGRLAAKLETLDNLNFEGVKFHGGRFVYAKCKVCGKQYRGDSYIWQKRHSESHRAR